MRLAVHGKDAFGKVNRIPPIGEVFPNEVYRPICEEDSDFLAQVGENQGSFQFIIPTGNGFAETGFGAGKLGGGLRVLFEPAGDGGVSGGFHGFSLRWNPKFHHNHA
jgi:hypothetical protein